MYVEMRPKKLPYNNMGNLAEIKFDGLVPNVKFRNIGGF